jgi:hypothetical protein
VYLLAWLALLSPSPNPTPVVTPGSTTPIQDVLMWAHLDFFITAGALLAQLAQIVAVFRTLVVATRSQRRQADLVTRQIVAYERQEQLLRYLGIDPAELGDGHDPEPQRGPRMPIRRGHERREERRDRRRVRAGDSYTGDDEVELEAPDPDAAAPPEADQVGPDEHEGGPDDDGRH